MKRFKPVGITALEYKEYRQNGCIRIKDYPIPSKYFKETENQPIPFTIHEILDMDERRSIYGLWSFSFGYYSVKSVEDFYEIVIEDESKIQFVIRRLNRFGLNPELDKTTNLIYADKP